MTELDFGHIIARGITRLIFDLPMAALIIGGAARWCGWYSFFDLKPPTWRQAWGISFILLCALP